MILHSTYPLVSFYQHYIFAFSLKYATIFFAMDTFRKHRKFWIVVSVIAGAALVLTSFLPYFALLQ